MGKIKEQWPGWFYGPNGEAAIFQSDGEVPVGWFDSPQKANSAVNSAEIAPVAAELQPIEIIEAKKADNSADELSAFAPKAKRPYRRRKAK